PSWDCSFPGRTRKYTGSMRAGPENASSAISAELDEVQRGQRPSGKLLQLSAARQPAEVDHGEFRTLQNAPDLQFGRGVVSRHEQHSAATGLLWICRQHGAQ